MHRNNRPSFLLRAAAAAGSRVAGPLGVLAFQLGGR
jgi:hypothetical protein